MRISTQQVLLGFLRKGFRRVVASEEILEHFLSNLGILGRNYVKKPVSGYGAETAVFIVEVAIMQDMRSMNSGQEVPEIGFLE